ncbi:MAG: hypothetical protein WDO73_05805 [Ignavibacteriota bacterium]
MMHREHTHQQSDIAGAVYREYTQRISTGEVRCWKKAISSTDVIPTISHPATSKSNDPALKANSDPKAKRLSSRKKRRNPRSRCR